MESRVTKTNGVLAYSISIRPCARSSSFRCLEQKAISMAYSAAALIPPLLPRLGKILISISGCVCRNASAILRIVPNAAPVPPSFRVSAAKQ